MTGEIPSAVRFFTSEHPRLPKNLRQKLQARFAELSGQTVAGLAKDWADYRERVGVMRGLAEAIDMCEQLEKDLER